jgi:hypothetical protein
MKIRPVTQLQLDGFADLLKDSEESGIGEQPLSWKEIKEREMAARLALQDKLDDGDIPTWAETYHWMIESGIPWKIAAYVAWSTTIKKYRWPRTLEELAVEVLGLNSPRRIFEWRRKYPYIDQMIADLQASAYLEYIPGAIRASGEVASRTDYKSTAERRLLFEATRIIETKKNATEDAGVNLGAGRKLLDQLRKKSTEELLDLLGEDAPELMQQLEEEFEKDDDEQANAE